MTTVSVFIESMQQQAAEADVGLGRLLCQCIFPLFDLQFAFIMHTRFPHSTFDANNWKFVLLLFLLLLLLLCVCASYLFVSLFALLFLICLLSMCFSVHGSAASLLSGGSSLYGSTAEERQAAEVRRLKRELCDAREQVMSLSSQLSTNVSTHELRINNHTFGCISTSHLLSMHCFLSISN